MSNLIRPGLARIASRYVCAECRFASSGVISSRWRVRTRAKDQELGTGVQVRGAKRTSIVKIKPIAQGVLPAKEVKIVNEDDGPVYSSAIQQHLNNMRKFSDCVVLTRMGNFYEVKLVLHISVA